MESQFLVSFSDELEKIAGIGIGTLKGAGMALPSGLILGGAAGAIFGEKGHRGRAALKGAAIGGGITGGLGALGHAVTAHNIKPILHQMGGDAEQINHIVSSPIRTAITDQMLRSKGF